MISLGNQISFVPLHCAIRVIFNSINSLATYGFTIHKSLRVHVLLASRAESSCVIVFIKTFKDKTYSIDFGSEIVLVDTKSRGLKCPVLAWVCLGRVFVSCDGGGLRSGCRDEVWDVEFIWVDYRELVFQLLWDTSSHDNEVGDEVAAEEKRLGDGVSAIHYCSWRIDILWIAALQEKW